MKVPYGGMSPRERKRIMLENEAMFFEAELEEEFGAKRKLLKEEF